MFFYYTYNGDNMKNKIVIASILLGVIALCILGVLYLKNRTVIDNEEEVFININDESIQNDENVKEVLIDYPSIIEAGNYYVAFSDENDKIIIKCEETNESNECSKISIMHDDVYIMNNLDTSLLDSTLNYKIKNIYLLNDFIIINITNKDNLTSMLRIFNKKGEVLYNHPNINNNFKRNVLIHKNKIYFEINSVIYYIDLNDSSLEVNKY